jgi:16S rRNA (cytosine1402-N4)-methyltransferase
MAHVPVLFDEVMEWLAPKPGDVIVDGTLGGGGHAEEILKRILPGGILIGMDRDPGAIERVSGKLERYSENMELFNCDFKEIGEALNAAGHRNVNGVLLDLGVSSFQIDEAERGFSYMSDGPLDMRFDQTFGTTAYEVVNKFSQHKLEEIIDTYGEERYAKSIAKNICLARAGKRIFTTKELSEVIIKAVGSKYREQRIHPATRTFQAIRIYVNDELVSLDNGIQKNIEYLFAEGRICVISFQSLEDRIVKNIFKENEKNGKLRILTKKPIVPGVPEVARNPRARSAKLRAAAKAQ